MIDPAWSLRRLRRVLLVGIGCAICCTGSPILGQGSAAGPTGRSSPAEQQLSLLRQVMLRWTQGTAPRPAEVREIFAADTDPRAEHETACPARIEADLVKYLADRQPNLLLPLAFWQVNMLFGAMDWAGSSNIRAVDIDRVYDRLQAYHSKMTRGADSPSRERVDRNAVLAWIGVAELFSRLGSLEFYQRADEAARKALEIDRDATVAKYWSAWLSERIPHQPFDLIRPWRELAKIHPDRAEYRLRFAIAAKRAERVKSVRESLEWVARGDGAEWMRILAYEEWVQSLLDGTGEDRQAARDILQEARQAFPGRPGLDLLASYLLLESHRRQALRLAERVEAHVWGEGEISPRLHLEIPSEEEVGPTRRELAVVLRDGWRGLGAQLSALNPDDVLSRRSRTACRRRDGPDSSVTRSLEPDQSSTITYGCLASTM